MARARLDPSVRVHFVWVFSMDFDIHVSEFPCVFINYQGTHHGFIGM